jgi:hypothetical protein
METIREQLEELPTGFDHADMLHALIADVFTSTTATSPQCGSTRPPQALRRVAAVLGEMWPCAADHDL